MIARVAAVCAVFLTCLALFLALAVPQPTHAQPIAAPAAADGCAGQTVGQFCVRYFANPDLSGDPVFSQLDSFPIDHDWSAAGPVPGLIPTTHYSARWTGKFSVDAASTYTFTAVADDGVRVYVDGSLLIDAWKIQAPTTYRRDVTLAAGEHDLQMEYYQNEGLAVAKLTWQEGCQLGQYRAEYFGNKTLSGSPVLSRCEAAPLAHDWGNAAPAPEVKADVFSARWIGTFDFASDVYTFTATADDGIRVWVDGQLLIDRWLDQAPTTYRASRSLTAGRHDVRVEYYENLGGAVAKLSWAQGCPSGQYWTEYFANKSLSGIPTFVRCESAPISHNWGSGGPGSGIGVDGFSARWTGTFSFAQGNYAFWVTGDDGVRLWVDGQLIVDKWFDQAPADYSAVRSLAAGSHKVKLEYYENGGGAVAKLNWVKGADIGLDPGHHRLDIGAVGGGLYEYQVTLDIAFRARTILQAAGYSVNLSRTDSNPVSSWSSGSYDANLPIEMAARIRAVGPVRAYVPIHLNGSTNSTLRGTESYYNVDNNVGNRSYLLASALQPNVVSRIRAAGYWAVDRGVHSDLVVGKPYGHYFSLRGPYTSALVECLFLSNPTDASQLAKSTIRQAIAQGIADGLIAYLRQNG